MTSSKSLDQAISDFGAVAAKKLGNRDASGEPEDQLRAPFEALLHDLSALCGFAPGAVVTVAETSRSDLKTRPRGAGRRRASRDKDQGSLLDG